MVVVKLVSLIILQADKQQVWVTTGPCDALEAGKNMRIYTLLITSLATSAYCTDEPLMTDAEAAEACQHMHPAPCTGVPFAHRTTQTLGLLLLSGKDLRAGYTLVALLPAGCPQTDTQKSGSKS